MPTSNSRAPTLQLHSPAEGGGGSISPARLAEGSCARTRRRSTVSSRAPPPASQSPAPSRSRSRPLPRALWACKEVPARPLHSRAHPCAARGWPDESAAILFFSWFQWREEEEAGSGVAGGGTRRGCCCHRRRHHRSWGSWREEGGLVRPEREPAAAPLREGRRRDGDGGYR